MNSLQFKIFPFLIIFFEMATYLSSDMYLPALPTVAQDFHVFSQEAQLTITMWFLGSVTLQLILGPLADRFGRKIFLCLGAFSFVVSTLICAVTHDFTIFLLARFVQGSAICFMAVPGYASIHESYDQKQAIKILALMSGITIFAPALGPILGSLLLIHFNWRWIFYFLVGWGILSFILFVLFMPETLPREKRHPLSLKTIFSNYWMILKTGRFLRIIIVFGLLIAGFITWIVAGPFLIIEHFHYSNLVFSLLQALIFSSFIISGRLIKFFIDRIPLHFLIQIGLLISFLGALIGLILSFFFPEFLWGIILTYVIYSFGAGFALAPLNRLSIESLQAPMGARMAMFSTLVGLFFTSGTILITLFYTGTLLSLALIIFVVVTLAVGLWSRYAGAHPTN